MLGVREKWNVQIILLKYLSKAIIAEAKETQSFVSIEDLTRALPLEGRWQKADGRRDFLQTYPLRMQAPTSQVGRGLVGVQAPSKQVTFCLLPL